MLSIITYQSITFVNKLTNGQNKYSFIEMSN